MWASQNYWNSRYLKIFNLFKISNNKRDTLGKRAKKEITQLLYFSKSGFFLQILLPNILKYFFRDLNIMIPSNTFYLLI